MKVSVVINTYNRASNLRNTLAGLRYQTYQDFEVVVVNGPSTDRTADVLAEYADMARVYRCPDVHLSKSRNIGITHAAGDVVAFIDDDSVPDPRWVADLADGYTSADIGGTGGLVFDHTGVKLQYKYSACSRTAVTEFGLTPPFDRYSRPGADPFLYLQGTNCSFRRDVLAEIGGFNDEIEYYLDETEVCLLATDAGYQIRPLDRAIVYHKYAPSHIRTSKRVVLDPYTSVKNHCTFAVRYGPATRPMSDVLSDVAGYLDRVKSGGRGCFQHGTMTADQLAYYLDRAEAGAEFGIRQGMTVARPFTRIPAARESDFRPFPTHRPEGGRLKTVFVSREFPPDTGGVGRLTSDLSAQYARFGHEVRVVTHGPAHTVDFEDGVWVHRVPDGMAASPSLAGKAGLGLLENAAAVYREVDRIHALNGVDVVSAPVWLCEGAICNLDPRWQTLLYLVTTMTTIAQVGGAPETPEVRAAIALEREALGTARHVYANSRAILDKVVADVGKLSGTTHVVHHATPDVRDQYPPALRVGGGVRILFVGRIETRKGVDVLLAAAYEVLAACPDAELHLIGKNNPIPGEHESIFDRHLRAIESRPDLDARIVFHGMLPDDDVRQAYADCDVVVLPSKYESFGLVLTEGMMFGKPVVGVRAGGPTEIIADGENGYLVPPDDVSALATALRKLVESAELRATFGERSREIYEAKFTTEIMAAKTVVCHRSVCRSGAADRVNGPALRESVAKLVGRVTGVGPEVAAEAAEELVAPSWEPLTPAEYVRRASSFAGLSDERFVREVFCLIVHRPPTAEERHNYRIHLGNGMPRKRVLAEVATGAEAQAHRVPTDWITDVDVPTPTAPATGRPRLKARMSGLARRVIHRTARLPIIGIFVRAGVHIALAPRRLRRLEDRTAAMHDLFVAQFGALHGAFQAQAAASAALATETELRDRRMHWAVASQPARVAQALAASARPAVVERSA